MSARMGARLSLATGMTESTLSIALESYAGYKGEETPRRFTWGSRTVEVVEVCGRWLAPSHAYFKVVCDDGGTYLLRHDVSSGRWDLTECVPVP